MNQSSVDPSAIVREVGLPIYQSKGWLRFLGVLVILYGIMTAATIVGIVIAWLPIWMGVLLMQAAGSVERAHVSGDRQPLYDAMSKLKTFFTIQGILALIGLVGFAMAFALGLLGTILEILQDV